MNKRELQRRAGIVTEQEVGTKPIIMRSKVFGALKDVEESLARLREMQEYLPRELQDKFDDELELIEHHVGDIHEYVMGRE